MSHSLTKHMLATARTWLANVSPNQSKQILWSYT